MRGRLSSTVIRCSDVCNQCTNAKWGFVMKLLRGKLRYIYIFCILFSPAVIADEPERFVHFSYLGENHYGLITKDNIRVIEGDIFSHYTVTEKKLSLSEVELLPATYPSKIIAIGLNYRSHFSSSKGRAPRLFSKLPSSITTHNKPVWLFPDSTNLHFEGELVVVIGKKGSNIPPQQVDDYIFALTVGNDITDRTWQGTDLQWIRAKGADSFSPLAPWMLRGVDYSDLLIETRLNGKTVQSESTKNLLFTVEEIVSYASQYFTLLPGDLIFTGTPGSTQAMKSGDIVEVEINQLGVLRNKIVAKK